MTGGDHRVHPDRAHSNGCYKRASDRLSNFLHSSRSGFHYGELGPGVNAFTERVSLHRQRGSRGNLTQSKGHGLLVGFLHLVCFQSAA